MDVSKRQELCRCFEGLVCECYTDDPSIEEWCPLLQQHSLSDVALPPDDSQSLTFGTLLPLAAAVLEVSQEECLAEIRTRSGFGGEYADNWLVGRVLTGFQKMQILIGFESFLRAHGIEPEVSPLAAAL